jgi:tellurite resistance protein
LEKWRQGLVRASILEYWSNKIQRLRGRGFLDAAMAAAALVSTADEDVRLSEQYALDHLVQRMDQLRLFDPHTAADLHQRYVERIEADSGERRSTPSRPSEGTRRRAF